MQFMESVLKAVGHKMDFLSIHTYATGASAINDGESPHVDNILKRTEAICVLFLKNSACLFFPFIYFVLFLNGGYF